MMETVELARLSWTEYRERLDRGLVVMVPVGALEQHGHHLPLGVDALIATSIAEMAARRIDGLVAPAIPYGYRSQPRTGGGSHYPGTTGLDGATLTLVLRDVLRELAIGGAKRLVVVDGHYENEMFLTDGVELAIREIRRERIDDVRVVKLRYFEHVGEDTIRLLWPEGYPGMALEHAALMETSMMLHLAPELVDVARAPDEPDADFPHYDVFPPNPSWAPPAGALSSPRRATATFGKHLVDAFVELVVDAVERELA
jgi:creatinine amidohydrolase